MPKVVSRKDIDSRLTFEEGPHLYRWDGRIVPSVTQAMKPITKLWVSGDQLEFTRQQGKAIDLMIEFDVAGNLDEDNLPDWVKPILASWRQFVDETGFTLIESKPRLYHMQFGFAGEADLVGTMSKIKRHNNIHHAQAAIIDIKRTIPKTAAIQTAAYCELWNFSCDHPVIARRFALSLNPYRLVEYKDKGDWDTFLACLSIHRYMERTK